VHCGGELATRARSRGSRHDNTTMNCAATVYKTAPRGLPRSEYAKLLPYAIGSLRHYD